MINEDVWKRSGHMSVNVVMGFINFNEYNLSDIILRTIW